MNNPRSTVEEAFQAYVDRVRSGQTPDVAAFLEQQPADVRRDLRRMIDDYRSLRQRMGGATPILESGRVLGDFVLARELGRGGMAVVWEAEQQSLKRRVALKLLAPHHALSPNALERFEREARAGGRLAHPGIVQTYAVGQADGTHFIAQELVPGGYTLADSLADLREARDLPNDFYRGVATLFRQIADALQHAHDEGVIHRDVKPSNILLAEDDTPRVVDFGLARIQDELALSRTGDLEGTPYYMSPEQAAAKSMGIDHRTDVFSLGSTLYEALTLLRPFEGDTTQHVFRKILTVDPQDPRAIRSRVPRDLAVICLKALEKDPHRRYQTMAGFRDDLARYLADQPIVARPPGPVARATKWIRRHPTVSAAGAVTVAAAAGLFGMFMEVQARRADSIRSEAEANSARISERLAQDASATARSEADRRDYLASIAQAASAVREGFLVWAADRLEESPRDLRGWEWDYLRLRSRSGRALLEHQGNLVGVETTPKGSYFATLGKGERLARVHDSGTGAPLFAIESAENADKDYPIIAAFDPRDRFVAVGYRRGSVRIWDLATKSPLQTLDRAGGRIRELVFSSDGEWLLGRSSASMRLWQASRGFAHHDLGERFRRIDATSFSADGSQVLVASKGGLIRTWELGQAEPRLVIEGTGADIVRAVFLGDGEQLASYDREGVLRVWRASDGSKLRMIVAHDGSSETQIVVSDSGSLAVCICRHRRHDNVRLIDLQSGATVRTWRAHADGVYDAAFASAGTRLVTMGGVGTAIGRAPGTDPVLRLWDTSTGELVSALEGHERPVTAVVVSEDGATIASGSKDRTIRLWDAISGALVRVIRGQKKPVVSLEFCNGGHNLVSIGQEEGTLQGRKTLWHWTTDFVLPTGRLHLPLNQTISGEVHVSKALFDGTGEHVLVAGAGQGAVLRWNATTGEPAPSLELEDRHDLPTCVGIDLLAETLVAGTARGNVSAWDLGTRRHIQSNPATRGVDPNNNPPVIAVAVSPDGSRAVWSGGSEIGSWSVESGEALTHSGFVPFGASPAMAFSADGTLLATADLKGGIQLWNARTLERTATLTGHTAAVWDVEFDRAGTLLSASLDSTVRLWDLETLQPIQSFHGHRDHVYGACFLPDGIRVATASRDGSLRIWDRRTGEQLYEERVDGEGLWSLSVSPDGSSIAATILNSMGSGAGWGVVLWHASADRAARFWSSAGSRGTSVALRPSDPRPSETAAAHLAASQSHLDTGHYESAVSAARKAIETDSGSSLAHLLEARALAARQKPEAGAEAVDALRGWAAKQPGSAATHTALAQVLIDLGCFSQAVQAAERAVELEPSSIDARSWLGSALLFDGQVEQSAEVLRSLGERAARSGWYFRVVGDSLSLGRDLTDAIEAYESAVRTSSNDAFAHAYLGTALLAQGDIDRSIEHLRRAVEANPTAEWVIRQSRAVAASGDLEGALATAFTARDAPPSLGAQPPIDDWIRWLEQAVRADELAAASAPLMSALVSSWWNGSFDALVHRMLGLTRALNPDRAPPTPAARAFGAYLRLDYSDSFQEFSRVLDAGLAHGQRSPSTDTLHWAGAAGAAHALNLDAPTRTPVASKALDWLEAELDQRDAAVHAGASRVEVDHHRWYLHRSLLSPDFRVLRDPPPGSPWAERAAAYLDRVRGTLCAWSGVR